ncbi:MAG TPA: hypothetical protein VG346_06090 [Acidimicrobiales bacterium]|jgi:hypothetical protein|nr:hypothetical protein [Acidimicrobiales bacterium]
MKLTSDQCWSHLAEVDHGVLCTTGARGAIDAVPVCFVVVGKVLVSPIDTVKAKESTELGRLKNLDRDATATLLCERWVRHDWSQLWWVRTQLVRRSGHDLTATLRQESETALRHKYFQYRGTEFADLLVFDVKSVSGWAAEPKTDDKLDRANGGAVTQTY